MEIKCKEYYEEVMKYAKRIKDDSFQKCIDNLKRWENNARCQCEIVLFKGHAPYCIDFYQRCYNGAEGVAGCIAYHGTPDQSMCYQIEPRKGWQIHT